MTEKTTSTSFQFNKKKIIEFCERWDVIEFSLFGSVLRDDFNSDSDIDVLISFSDDAHWSLLDFVDMKDELKEIFGREVDLLEKGGLRNPFRKRAILDSKVVLYAV